MFILFLIYQSVTNFRKYKQDHDIFPSTFENLKEKKSV